ncbi:hypothetical protein KAX02_11210 [candidate division WOR-3 bacterium]|nr:hypothetical protein [candidate division WOR-3 bacterium]
MTVHRVEMRSAFITFDELALSMRMVCGEEYLIEGRCVRCGKETFLKHYKTKLGEMRLCRECVNELTPKTKSAHLKWEEWEQQMEEVQDALDAVNIFVGVNKKVIINERR